MSEVEDRRQEVLQKIARVIAVLRRDAKVIAHEAVVKGATTVTINVRITSAKYPSVCMTFEQFAMPSETAEEEFKCLSKP